MTGLQKLFPLVVLIVCASCKNKESKSKPMVEVPKSEYYKESYRPQFHFTPEEKWMNDPNGMVFHKGVYHLFYQYYPEDIVWGPMHWGHATSVDLVHWQHKPIALFPDEHGYIFSGSAVVDKNNTSGFGTTENPPLVAIFTYHDMEGEKAGKLDFQTQGIAYSLDDGETWLKYKDNPVIGNNGIKDFRDPKVIWHEPSQQWILTLVAGDHAKFYGSKNLRDWQLMSEFGKDRGAHGGVWECPDLFPIHVKGAMEEKWVLLISINPGAPNGGSGTQYFVGDFDGNTFTTDQKEVKWIDWGTDNYAGVTFSNAPKDKRIFIGWMSNWQYARNTPTETWRSAMTVPRRLTLLKEVNGYDLANYPVRNMDTIFEGGTVRHLVVAPESKEQLTFENLNQVDIRFTTSAKNFNLKFGSAQQDELSLTMMGDSQSFVLDRSKSGIVDFQEDFGKGKQQMPVPLLPNGEYEVRILMDWSSIEIFVNKGQYVMTAQVFPRAKYNSLEIENTSKIPLEFNDFEISKLKGIWTP